MDSRCIKSRDLLEAVQRGRQEEVVARLRQGEPPNTTFTLGRTPLHCAAANSNLPAVIVLLEHGADIKICDSNGYSALHMACSRRGADSTAIVDKLLEAGAEINLGNRFQRSPLHECVIVENMEAAQILLAAGADTGAKDREGKTARELAFARDSYEIAELLGGHPVGAAALSIVAERKVEEEGPMTVEQEKEALKRRLAELEEGERRALETRLGGKRVELEEVKDDYRSRREVAMAEIQRLDTHVKALQAEECRKVADLEAEIQRLGGELGRCRGEGEAGSDLEELLMCPVCLDVAKPPLQVWQCPEGHIICGSCADRPELLVCPQCRVSLSGGLSRNRALEDLARRTFPREAEAAAREARGRGRGGQARAGRQGRGGRRARQQVFSQVDQNIDFRYLRAPRDPRVLLQDTPGLVTSVPGAVEEELPGLLPSSSDDEGGYDLTSEVYLEDVDDEFMPNLVPSFNLPDSTTSTVRSGGAASSSRASAPVAAIVQRMHSIRLGTSPRHSHSSARRHRRSSPSSTPGSSSRRLGRASDTARGALEEEDEEELEWGEVEEQFDTLRNMIPAGVQPRAARSLDQAGLARGRRGVIRARYSGHLSESRQTRNMR